MTVYESTTELAPAEVIELARGFFARIRSPNAAAVDRAGDAYLRLHLDMGEIVIAAIAQGDATRVRGSASRGAALLTRFLTTLPESNPVPAGRARARRAA